MNASQQVELGKLFFEDGIPGFSHLQFFQLMQEEESPFFLLQSTEEQKVGFWVVDPFSFFPDYTFTLPDVSKEALHLTEETPVAVLVIVTIRSKEQVTVNLKAPILINLNNRMAKQVILQDDTYPIRQPLFAMQAADAK